MGGGAGVGGEATDDSKARAEYGEGGGTEATGGDWVHMCAGGEGGVKVLMLKRKQVGASNKAGPDLTRS